MDMEPHTMLLELGPTSSSGLWTPKAALPDGNQAGHAPPLLWQRRCQATRGWNLTTTGCYGNQAWPPGAQYSAGGPDREIPALAVGTSRGAGAWWFLVGVRLQTAGRD